MSKTLERYLAIRNQTFLINFLEQSADARDEAWFSFFFLGEGWLLQSKIKIKKKKYENTHQILQKNRILLVGFCFHFFYFVEDTKLQRNMSQHELISRARDPLFHTLSIHSFYFFLIEAVLSKVLLIFKFE